MGRLPVVLTMSGLVGYNSSDEDEEVKETLAPPQVPNGKGSSPRETIIGPSIPVENIAENEELSARQSPYSANYNMIRDLTLPTVPNLEIPPSPPDSPSPGMEKKFAHFLELKKQGVHFNEKLARSSALKNPALLQKLMASAGMEESDQYKTTLPRALWDPSGFPPWAYKEELAQSQQKLLATKEEECKKVKRDALDFVPASASEQSSRANTPAGDGGPRSRGSATERVMAGLNRDRGISPQTSSLASRAARERRHR